MDFCEFKASLVYIVSSRKPGLYKETLAKNKTNKTTESQTITTHRCAVPTTKMECGAGRLPGSWLLSRPGGAVSSDTGGRISDGVRASSEALSFLIKLQFMQGMAGHTCHPTNALLSLKGRGGTPENPLGHETTKNTRNTV